MHRTGRDVLLSIPAFSYIGQNSKEMLVTLHNAGLGENNSSDEWHI